METGRTWKLMDSGGRLQGLRSRVVAISSTLAVSVCSASPVNCKTIMESRLDKNDRQSGWQSAPRLRSVCASPRR